MASDHFSMSQKRQPKLGLGRRGKRPMPADQGLRLALAEVVGVICVFAMLNLLFGL